MLKIALVGVGTVGSSVAKILEENKEIISARCGKEIVVVKGVVKNLNRKRDVNIPLTDSIDEVLNDDSIDVIVELMGGVDEAYEIVKKALQNNKSVVTANKALLAYHRYELQELAKSNAFEYEASVAGGIPIINALRDGLSANHIESIKGIMNGTCNFILTKMTKEGANFKDTLKEAQELGYAEADPTFDVGGFDAAHKLLILASIAYGIDCKPEEILIDGIDIIDSIDIEFAKEFEYKIKLLTIAKKVENKVELRVHPTLIDENEMIAKVDGVMNGVSVVGDKVGETMYYGAGAGGDATASAVIADLVNIARNGKGSPMLGYKTPLENNLVLQSKDDIISKYYIRICVKDRAGVLAKVSSVLGNRDISIEAMIQKPTKKEDCANLLFITHLARELDIQNAIKELEALEFVATKIVMVRVDS